MLVSRPPSFLSNLLAPWRRLAGKAPARDLEKVEVLAVAVTLEGNGQLLLRGEDHGHPAWHDALRFDCANPTLQSDWCCSAAHRGLLFIAGPPSLFSSPCGPDGLPLLDARTMLQPRDAYSRSAREDSRAIWSLVRSTSREDAPEELRPDIPVPSPLEVGREYEVQAIAVVRGKLFYLVETDDCSVSFQTACQFDLTATNVPRDWICSSFREGPLILLGPDMVASSIDQYNAIVDSDFKRIQMVLHRIHSREPAPEEPED